MASPRVSCLNDFELLEIVDGTCAPAVLPSLLEHVDGCPTCRDLLAGLMAENCSTVDSLEGSSVGHYRFGPLLAEGGMGRVYRAVDLDLDRPVAIKVPRTNSAALMQRFEREISISARLAHPGVVPIHGTGKLSDGTPFYVMRFVDGDSLDVLHARATSVEQRLELLPTLINVAETMGYVHSQGIAHRDLKPNNVLVGRFGEIVIIDWGLAKELPKHRSHVPQRPSFENMAPADAAPLNDSYPPAEIATRAGDVLGTPAFMAPEQANGEVVDCRADVYALGAMLWHLLTRRIPTPFVSFDDEMLIGVPLAVVAVAKRAMSIDREARFADAGEFATALRDASRPVAPSINVPPHHVRTSFVVAAIAALGIAGSLALWMRHRHLASAREPSKRDETSLEFISTDLLGDAALRLSPSGNRIAIGSASRFTVRDLVTGQTWLSTLPVEWPVTLQFDGENTLVFGETANASAVPFGKRVKWNLDTGQTTELATTAPEGTSRWLGSLDHGDLFLAERPTRLYVVADGALKASVDIRNQTAVYGVTISPNKRRFAFPDSGKFQGVISMADSSGTTLFTSDPMPTPTALTWFDDDHILYSATPPSGQGSSLFIATASVEGFRHPTELYRYDVPDHWIGGLTSVNGRIVAAITKSTFQSTLVDRRGSHSQVNLDNATASAPLLWLDNNSFWTSNRNNNQVELHHVDATTPTVLPIHLGGDPADATRAGDILIVAERAESGRRVEAYSLTDHSLRWNAEPGDLLFVRCAGDQAPPCVAARQINPTDVEIRRIDPATGSIGEVIVAASKTQDAAISVDGTTIAWIPSDRGASVSALALNAPATVLHDLGSQATAMHSLAFDNEGNLLLARTGVGRSIVSVHPDGTTEPLVHSAANVIAFIRPSPDGAHLLYRSRSFGGDLAVVHLSTTARAGLPKH